MWMSIGDCNDSRYATITQWTVDVCVCVGVSSSGYRTPPHGMTSFSCGNSHQDLCFGVWAERSRGHPVPLPSPVWAAELMVSGFALVEHLLGLRRSGIPAEGNREM